MVQQLVITGNATSVLIAFVKDIGDLECNGPKKLVS
jgi:hypothetical protein